MQPFERTTASTMYQGLEERQKRQHRPRRGVFRQWADVEGDDESEDEDEEGEEEEGSDDSISLPPDVVDCFLQTLRKPEA